jgi:hypothetical protein
MLPCYTGGELIMIDNVKRLISGLINGRHAGLAPYYQPFSITFERGKTALAVRTPPNGDVQKIIAALRVTTSRPAVFISGGAGLMQGEEMLRTRPIIEDGLVRLAEEHNVAVIDGGTDSGVMKLIGDARRARGYHFPLIGIAPIGVVNYPGYDSRHPDAAQFNSGHSHFVLVEGSEFGAESLMIAELTKAIAGNHKALGIIINGGEITRKETYDRAVAPDLDFPLIVLEGSGRFADEVAQAKLGSDTQDIRIPEILKRSDVRVASIRDGAEKFYAQLTQYLT